MITLFAGENDADNKKKSGSMSDDGMLFFFFFLFYSIPIMGSVIDLSCPWLSIFQSCSFLLRLVSKIVSEWSWLVSSSCLVM
jgi:hypothetical protein